MGKAQCPGCGGTGKMVGMGFIQTYCNGCGGDGWIDRRDDGNEINCESQDDGEQNHIKNTENGKAKTDVDKGAPIKRQRKRKVRGEIGSVGVGESHLSSGKESE